MLDNERGLGWGLKVRVSSKVDYRGAKIGDGRRWPKACARSPGQIEQLSRQVPPSIRVEQERRSQVLKHDERIYVDRCCEKSSGDNSVPSSSCSTRKECLEQTARQKSREIYGSAINMILRPEVPHVTRCTSVPHRDGHPNSYEMS